jgi:hypothetical protein
MLIHLLPLVWLGSMLFVVLKAQGQQRSSSNPSVSTPEEKAIIVWKVGGRERGDTPNTAVPPDLQLRAGESGYKLKIEAFAARGFAEAFFDAFEKNQEPDILAIYDYGIIASIATPLGSLGGTRSGEKIGRELVQVTESLANLEGTKRGRLHIGG